MLISKIRVGIHGVYISMGSFLIFFLSKITFYEVWNDVKWVSFIEEIKVCIPLFTIPRLSFHDVLASSSRIGSNIASTVQFDKSLPDNLFVCSPSMHQSLADSADGVPAKCICISLILSSLYKKTIVIIIVLACSSWDLINIVKDLSCFHDYVVWILRLITRQCVCLGMNSLSLIVWMLHNWATGEA